MKEVVKLNRFFSIYELDGNLIILPVKPPICTAVYGDEPCFGEMLLHDFRCYYHPGVNHYHCDVHLKCPKCGNFVFRGLAIPPELLGKLQASKYHGKTLRWELKEIYGEKLPKEVEERLKKWGYY